MRSLKNLLTAVESVNNTLPVEQSFVNDLLRSIEQTANTEVRKPSHTFKPSSIGGCERNIYFQLIGADVDTSKQSSTSVGICESGTDRHIRIQQAIIDMKNNGIDCEYVDIEDFVKLRNLTDVEIVSKSGIETKCYNKKYNISFLTDGIIKYKGKYYILEIKTEISRKFWDHTDVRQEHIAQGVAYFISFGISDVLYLYENRDTLDKKCYHLVVTDCMAESIVQKMYKINRYVEQNKVPPKQETKKGCNYCSYRTVCKQIGDTNGEEDI